MIRLIIFDLDGTLLNTIDDLAVCTNHALCLHGFPKHELSEYRYFVGNGITKLIERALPEKFRDETTLLRVRHEFVAYYQQHKTDLTHPYAGIPQLLQDLKHKGIRLAVASNKYHQGTTELIHHYFGTSLFDIVSGQQEGIPVKPNPAIVENILLKANCSPSDTLYVGDSGVDMQTARNSGLTSIGVTWGFRSRDELIENGADHITDHPREILDIVEKF